MKNIILLLFILIESFSLNCDGLSYDERRKPIVIAHRGASGYLPEHTFAAKVAGYLMNADYVEQDVVLTKDDVPIVLHDIYIDTVTNVAEAFPNKKRQDGRFYAIDLTFDEIKSLKVSERFDHKNPSKPIYSSRFPLNQASFRLNSLEEEIQLVQGLTKSLNTIYELDKTNLLTAKKRFNTGVYVELKDPKFHQENGKKNFAEIVFKILDKYNYKNKNDNIIIQCFDADELRRIRQELKSNLTLVQLLYPENLDSYFTFWNSKEGLDQIAKFADGIGPEISQLITWNKINKNTVKESEFYKNAKKLGLFIHPYTFRIDSLPPYVNNFVELLDLYINKLKVDGLFTDFPDLAIKYIESSGNNLKFNSLYFLFYLLFVFSKLF